MSPGDGRVRPFDFPAMPNASGIECVRVLIGHGWMPVTWSLHECRLQREGVELTIPLDPVLSSSEVATIVEVAGLSPFVFVEGLEKIRTGRIAKTPQDPGEGSKAG